MRLLYLIEVMYFTIKGKLHFIPRLNLHFVVNSEVVELSCAKDTDTKYCLNSTVQYQCSIADDDTALVWKVFNAAGKCVSQPYSTGCKKNDVPQLIAPDFSIYLISCDAKLISNISFTTHLHHEGYKVECSQYTDGGQAKTCNIAIAGHYFALHIYN